jgi:pilus assembly protein TadC
MPEQIEMALTGLCSQDWEGVWEERMSLAINLKPRKYLSRGFPLYLPLPCLLIQLLLLLLLFFLLLLLFLLPVFSHHHYGFLFLISIEFENGRYMDLGITHVHGIVFKAISTTIVDKAKDYNKEKRVKEKLKNYTWMGREH